ncbi:MAG TPA: VWA domain-containing protein [Candidatus Limiplasma sp.]|nr:VWA domain-containing protein [Candidatus Limiplasma sp.]
MHRHTKRAALIVSLLLTLTLLTGCGRQSELTAQQATESLSALLSKISVTTLTPRMDISGTDTVSAAEELPDISGYPLSVTGDGQIDVEIVASTEKAGSGMDGWLNVEAENFNRQGFTYNNRRVSVSIRPIASGLATDYIASGTYVPPAFSPTNELWAEMLASKGVTCDLVVKRLAGNTAGILMSKKAYADFTAKNGDVTLPKILNAVLNGDLLLGYTNPYASSTGLNILTAMLQAFDPEDPLSATAVEKLQAFQKQVPPVAYTTAQMRESAKKGVLDAMIMEYQAYIVEPTLSDYVFTPFGVRHDSPVYAMAGITADQKAALKLFTDYCLAPDAQKEAKRYGFNALDDYAGQTLNLKGAQLYTAQKVWKENKDGGQPVVAVFVADTSGSMDGTPLAELKSSLLNAAQYIGEGNYIGLISYADDVYINLPIAEFTGKQVAYFNGAVKDLYATGSTATYDAVLQGIQMLLDQKKQLPDAKLMLFVLSDGAQNRGYSLDQITPVVQGLSIPIHTIGYGSGADMTGLAALSAINEASSTKADESNVVYNLKNIFNSQI